ncbi:MAG: radical SAM protein [Candidatus Njordarchaeia archaeon]
MSTADTVLFLKKNLDNRIVRNALKLLLKKNKRYNKTYLELGLETYTGEKRKTMDPRILLSNLIVKRAIKTVLKSFDGDEEEVKEMLRKPYDRRAVAALIKGFLNFGIRKPFVPGAPFLVVWDYTYNCNLRCKHCYINAGVRRPEMTLEERKKALDIMADAGVVSIAFSGGEPLMGPGIFDMIKAATDYGMFTAIATNGTLITKSVAEKLKKAGLGYAQISLDAPIPEVHDEFRGIPGAWERTVKGIKNAKEAGIMVEISTTITRHNIHLVDQMLELVKDLGVDYFMHFNFVPTGRGKEILETDITPDQREALLKSFAKKLYEGFPVPTLSTAPQLARVTIQVGEELKTEKTVIGGHFYGFETQSKAKDVAEFLGGCGAGRLYISLEPNGDIQPCVFLPIKVGNILVDDFEDLWLNSKVLNDLRDREKYEGFCGTCPFKYVCGGCRARAYAYYGDYLAPDPGCIYNKKEWERLKKEIERETTPKVSSAISRI